MKHYLPGKARSLEDALDVMRTRLDELGFTLIESNWLNPVPGVWSVHVKAQQCPALFANGKGISREAALASAYGEFLERLLTGYFYGDYALACDRLDWVFTPDERQRSAQSAWSHLPEDLRLLWTDDQGELPDDALMSLSCCSEPVRCIPLVPLHGAEVEIEVPWNVLMNFYGSNGLCAGNTEREAQIQGLSEIFERRARHEIIKRNLCLPEIPESIWSRSEAVVAAREALASLGIEISIRDASLGEGWPVVAIILYEAGKGRAFVSFGAHPIMQVAIERTLTEAFQGRRLDDLSAYQPPSDDLEWIQSWENLELHFIDASGQFHWRFFADDADWDFQQWGLELQSDLDSQWDYLLARLDERGQRLYGATYAIEGFYACRLVVPGLSEVFPPWELLENNQNTGCRLRAHLLRFEQTSGWHETLLDLIDATGWAPHQSVSSLAGLPVSDGNPWRGEKIVDLQLRAALALGDEDRVEALLDQACHLATGDTMREGGWRWVACWRAGMQMETLQESFRLLYGRQAIEMGRACVSGTPWRNMPMDAALLDDPLHRALVETHRGFRMRT